MPVERIDLAAPWQFAQGNIRREAPGKGRYRVWARFITGNPPNYEYCEVNYWLPDASGHENHTFWLSLREIINSRLHPTTFDGRELPSEAAEEAA